eukprot:TRINITY_DN6297_c0_g1_i1.p1 TRINITY_DN6297_c0_g1~~TRINITY_DN6297_c0_g1_i1.p1  ORF type:complete len:131 (-),score=59.65 TRINITY_DN6297_c0_g1_i1:165-557(-)
MLGLRPLVRSVFSPAVVAPVRTFCISPQLINAQFERSGINVSLFSSQYILPKPVGSKSEFSLLDEFLSKHHSMIDQIQDSPMQDSIDGAETEDQVEYHATSTYRKRIIKMKKHKRSKRKKLGRKQFGKKN